MKTLSAYGKSQDDNRYIKANYPSIEIKKGSRVIVKSITADFATDGLNEQYIIPRSLVNWYTGNDSSNEVQTIVNEFTATDVQELNFQFQRSLNLTGTDNTNFTGVHHNVDFQNEKVKIRTYRAAKEDTDFDTDWVVTQGDAALTLNDDSISTNGSEEASLQLPYVVPLCNPVFSCILATADEFSVKLTEYSDPAAIVGGFAVQGGKYELLRGASSKQSVRNATVNDKLRFSKYGQNIKLEIRDSSNTLQETLTDIVDAESLDWQVCFWGIDFPAASTCELNDCQLTALDNLDPLDLQDEQVTVNMNFLTSAFANALGYASNTTYKYSGEPAVLEAKDRPSGSTVNSGIQLVCNELPVASYVNGTNAFQKNYLDIIYPEVINSRIRHRGNRTKGLDLLFANDTRINNLTFYFQTRDGQLLEFTGTAVIDLEFLGPDE